MTEATESRENFIFSLCNDAKADIYKVLGVNPTPIQNMKIYGILEGVVEEAEGLAFKEGVEAGKHTGAP